MSSPVKVSTYNITGNAYLSANAIDVPTSAISGDFFTSGAVTGTSTDQKYLWILSGSSLQNINYYTEILTFPAGSYTSNSSRRTFFNESQLNIQWGNDQEQITKLIYIIDYTIDNHNKIHLNESLYNYDVEANSLGLLNIVIIYSSV